MGKAADVVREDLDYTVMTLGREFDAMAGSELLISGGAGFLGYYLLHAMLYWNQRQPKDRRVNITVYDNYIRGVPAWLSELAKEESLTLMKRSVLDPMTDADRDFDFIIHAAGIASPTYYRAYPIETMDANVVGLRNLLDYCACRKGRGHSVRGFLFFSSSEIYGDPLPANIPTEETYRGNVSCTGPRACYDESKRYGETLCVNFAQQHDLPIKIARPFNNYGPGLKITDRRVIPDFAQAILGERDIVMYSDGSPTRTFCYVADAVQGYYKILVEGRRGEPYNIGVEGPEISIADLAERMVGIGQELFGYQGRVIRSASTSQDYLTDNPNRRCPSISKARVQLGYAPSIPLDEGLRRSLIWYRENSQAEEA